MTYGARRGYDDTIVYNEALGDALIRKALSHKDNYSSSLRRCYGGSEKSPTGLYPAGLSVYYEAYIREASLSTKMLLVSVGDYLMRL